MSANNQYIQDVIIHFNIAGLAALVPAKCSDTREEIAEMIVFLGLDKSRYLTCQSITVDCVYLNQ
jgi:NAD(P)-dependent dehydrogenase (short-subunit alcohol dehydrogenase family)